MKQCTLSRSLVSQSGGAGPFGILVVYNKYYKLKLD
jgi:hypothetical protein